MNILKTQLEHKGPKRIIYVLAVIFAILFALGVIPKLLNLIELNKMHKETAGAIPVVHTILAHPAPFKEDITLPSNIDAILYATLYARVDGYLKNRYVDIGDHVQAGQLLATIDTPTVDQELNQSIADLAEARASLEAAKAVVERGQVDKNYADITAHRWENMAAGGAVSLQSRDEKVRAYNAQVASVKADVAQVKTVEALVIAKQAAVKRLQAQQNFKNVVAPFEGFITYRKVDPGALVTSGSSSTNLELFQIAKIDTLRIYVQVPQTIAKYLQLNQGADILVPEFPGRVFPGKVTHISSALDPASRTRQTEVLINNQDHTLLPGMYAQVKLTVQRADPWIKVLGTTLVPKSDGMYVVVVQNNKAHFQKVDIGRDFGDEVEIKSGLHGNEIVVVSPAIELREGDTVNPQPLNDG